MIPRVPFASCANVPDSSRTCFGPKRFLYRLHWPITGTDDAFNSHAPLKSIPLSFGPPQAATSNEYFLKLWTTSSSKCLPNSCLEIVENHPRERQFVTGYNTWKTEGWKKILDGRIFILCAVHVQSIWKVPGNSTEHLVPSFQIQFSSKLQREPWGWHWLRGSWRNSSIVKEPVTNGAYLKESFFRARLGPCRKSKYLKGLLESTEKNRGSHAVFSRYLNKNTDISILFWKRIFLYRFP